MKHPIETEVYLKVTAVSRDSAGTVRRIRVDGLTQRAPRVGVNAVAVRVRLRIPPEAFGPYTADVVVELPPMPTEPIVAEGTLT